MFEKPKRWEQIGYCIRQLKNKPSVTSSLKPMKTNTNQ